MRRFAMLGAAAVTSLALATPTTSAIAITPTAAADRGQSVEVSQTDVEKAGKIRLKRKYKGVQPGIGRQVITAFVKGPGKVKFTLKGPGLKKNKLVKIKNNRAVYKVKPLGTGKYKVTASFEGRKGSTKFKVWNSSLTVNSTNFTFSASAADTRTYAHLFGNVFFKDKPATDGYVDFYLNGKKKGGSESPNFLGFVSVNADSSYNAAHYFGQQITKGTGLAGANTGPFPPGTYTFQAFYTDDAAYEDYISSNVITVVVTP